MNPFSAQGHRLHRHSRARRLHRGRVRHRREDEEIVPENLDSVGIAAYVDRQAAPRQSPRAKPALAGQEDRGNARRTVPAGQRPRFPDKTALVACGKRLTYSQLDERSDELAQATARRAASQRGDRVVLLLDNSAEAVVAIFAVLKAGAVFSPGNPSTKADKLALHPQQLPGAGLITQQKLCRGCRRRAGGAPSVAVTIVAGGEAAPTALRTANEVLRRAEFATAPRRAGIDVDLAMLIYTSGSTGSPKGVMMTHRNIVAAATSITTYLENTADDIILNVLPLCLRLRPLSGADGGEGRRHVGARKVLCVPAGRARPMRRGAGHRLSPRAHHGGVILQPEAIWSRVRSRICATSPTPPPRCPRRTSGGCRRCSRMSRSTRCTV